jgi:Tol biopolymer transport system component
VRFLVRTQPDWSSRGALAFLGTGGLQVHLPGGKIVKLGVIGGDPSWAPSGNRLAFVGQPEGADEGATLRTINSDGSGLRTLWNANDRATPYAGPLAPTWSPDERWIAFIKTLEPAFTGAVYAIRPSGGPARVLTPP